MFYNFICNRCLAQTFCAGYVQQQAILVLVSVSERPMTALIQYRQGDIEGLTFEIGLVSVQAIVSLLFGVQFF